MNISKLKLKTIYTRFRVLSVLIAVALVSPLMYLLTEQKTAWIAILEVLVLSLILFPLLAHMQVLERVLERVSAKITDVYEQQRKRDNA